MLASRHALLATALSLLATTTAAWPLAASPAEEASIDLKTAFAGETRIPLLSGEEIARRAYDNLFGFDASISIVAKRREGDGTTSTSEFLLERKRAQGALRTLVLSMRPAAVRGTRVLQVNYDDGREETYAYVQAIGGEPMRARYRLAEPFLGTWHEIGSADPPPEILALAEYEVLGVEPGDLNDEPIYKVSVRPLAPRGYERTELYIARKDYAILEYRHYFAKEANPVLIAVAPRAAMVRFGNRVVPARIRYRDLAENAEVDVTLRHQALDSGSEALFFPRTFHRFPLTLLEDPGADDD